jgi:uncharacterized protein
MKLSLDRLKKERKTLLEYDEPRADGFDPREKPLGPLKVALEVRLLEDRTVAIKGLAKGEFTLVCDRCAATVSKSRKFEIDEVDEVTPEEASRREVDIGSWVLELVLEDIPMKVLCRPDCRGLCPECGVNLNKEACKHQSK